MLALISLVTSRGGHRFADRFDLGLEGVVRFSIDISLSSSGNFSNHMLNQEMLEEEL